MPTSVINVKLKLPGLAYTYVHSNNILNYSMHVHVGRNFNLINWVGLIELKILDL